MERALQSVMPALFERLDRIEARISALDRELHGLREHMEARFDQAREERNELGQRIVRVEGRLDEIVRVIDRQNHVLDRQTDKMDQWIERLVRLEAGRGPGRGKRAG
jgi:chromosome segregation ATPase